MNNQTCKWAAALLLPAVLWLEVIRQLRIEWTINPQYTYGWSVPFLALYLFLLRWKDRPAPRVSTKGAPARWLAPGLFFLLFLLLPIRVVQEANPGWRLVGWAMTVDVIGLTFYLVYLAGGGAWARHFAFPILFFFVAVPWPSALENVVIQNFTRANAAATVEVLNMLGVAAAQRGNVIEVATGVVGIDEACSGIRSFQAALMIALFLGEWNRFRWAQRWGLLGGAVVIVFLANSVRTYFLVWVAAKKSIAAIAKWHDSAGVSVLLIAFVLIWLLAGLLKGRGKAAIEKVVNPPIQQSTNPPIQYPAGQWPRFLVAGGIIWVAVCELATLFWFKAHERGAAAGVTWTVRWPEEKAGFHDRGFTPLEREMLKYTEGRAASWSDGDGSGWLVFFLRWKNPDSLMERVVAHDALMHQPDICLPGAGFRMVVDEGIRTFTTGGIAVPFRRQRFQAGGTALFVFHCVWEDTMSRAREGDIDWMETNPWRATKIRLRRVWEGKRYNGIRVLEIALAGVDSQNAADERIEAQLGTLLRLESGK